MPRILEKDMESTIENDLVSAGYFRRPPATYDKDLCLDSEMLMNFIIATQSEKWESYKKQLGDRAKDALFAKVKEEIQSRGTLSLFRRPFATYGVYFDFAYFKPASNLNESFSDKYRNNILSVMRQVKYSKKNENSLDMVIFLNGLPIATLELKDQLTGSGYNVEHAIRQYQTNREPGEPLFRYGRCLVHFALDEDLVYMATQLKGNATFFLPFNKGNHGDAGNPATYGFSTEYLWKEVFQKDSILDLLQHFIQETDILDDDGKPTGDKKILFPRYHQMDCVRGIVEHAKTNGSGNQYLIQHSAGSGKSNTISWLAHQISNIHDINDVNVFDSVIVITDRKILDGQLRVNVRAFEQNPGVVAGIEKGSKQLKEELQAGTKIIVSTLQKFPYIEDEMKSIPGKRFAVIIDEAHSSSSGEMSKSLKTALNTGDVDRDEDDTSNDSDELTYEDEINESMKNRGRQPNISYFAFTATPKPKTLELFGTKQNDGSFKPFHLYSMRQAIHEKFIKDVLPNYASYRTCFHMIKTIVSDPRYDKMKAEMLLKTYVELSKTTVKKKTAIIIDHFTRNCAHEMNGLAKAMMVCSSRAQAVKYKLAFDEYIKENNLGFKVLVAFSGEIEKSDKTSGEADYSESRMNGFSEDQTAEVFKGHEYRFLIVASKFQTGFDQPLLYAMYLNKKVQGVNAVQTLSRLNRVYPGKKDPITLDFVNDPKVVKKAFQDFYEDVELEEGSDPDKLYGFKRTLDEAGYYTLEDINKFTAVFFAKNFTQERLTPVLQPVLDRFQTGTVDDKEKFRAVLKTYVRVYAFLSQLISFSDPELEKLYVFGKILMRKLPYEKQKLPREVTQQVDLESVKVEATGITISVKPGNGGKFKPGDEDPSGGSNEFFEPLSEIIRRINEKYAGNFNDTDRAIAGSLLDRLKKDSEMKTVVNNKENSEDAVFSEFSKKFNEELQKTLEENFDFYKKINDDKDVKTEMVQLMFKTLYNSMKKAV